MGDEIMGFQFFTKPNCGHNTSSYDLRLRRHRDKNGRTSVSVYIGRNLLKKMKWQLGDRVCLGLDEDSGLACVNRIPGDSGYKLLNNNKDSKDAGLLYFRMAAENKFINLLIQPGSDHRILEEGEVEVNESMIVFDMLKKAVRS